MADIQKPESPRADGVKKRGAQIKRLLELILTIQDFKVATFARVDIDAALEANNTHVKERTHQRDLQVLEDLGILEVVKFKTGEMARPSGTKSHNQDYSRNYKATSQQDEVESHANYRTSKSIGKVYKLLYRRVTAAKRANPQPIPNEILTLLHIAMSLIGRFKDTDWNRAASDVIARMRSQVRQEDLDEFEHISKVFHVTSRHCPSQLSQTTVSALVRALPRLDNGAFHTHKGQTIEFSYKMPGAAKYEQRIVEPHFLYMCDYGTYLIGRDTSTSGSPLKSFGVVRIMGVRNRNKQWSGPVEAPQNYFSARFGVMRGALSEKIVLRFSPQVTSYMSEREWHHTETTKSQADGSIELSMKVAVTKDLVQWVASFGPDVKVLHGDRLRVELLKFHEDAVKSLASGNERTPKAR